MLVPKVLAALSKLPDDCKIVPPAEGECCSTCATDKCKPTGEISNIDGVLSWNPNPCEYCTCISGMPQCIMQDCAPFCVDNQPYLPTRKQYSCTLTMACWAGNLIIVPTVVVLKENNGVLCKTVLPLLVIIMRYLWDSVVLSAMAMISLHHNCLLAMQL